MLYRVVLKATKCVEKARLARLLLATSYISGVYLTRAFSNAVETTLRREIKEEVGVEVTDIQYLLDLAFIRPDGIPAIVLSFYCKYVSGDVVLDEDATEYAWICFE